MTLSSTDGDDLARDLGLVDSRHLDARHHVALVGGGGKTTLMHAIGSALDGPTILTCTTKMGADQHRGRPVLISPSDDAVRVGLREHGRVMVLRGVLGQKGVGITPERADELFRLGVHVVAESDGSRRRPAKAPHWYEPVLARTVTMVICVIGADALDRTIEDQCHRPLRVGAVLGCSPYDRLTPERAAELVTSPNGGRKDVPPEARFVVCLTKVDASVGALAERFVDAVAARGVAVRAVTHLSGG